MFLNGFSMRPNRCSAKNLLIFLLVLIVAAALPVWAFAGDEEDMSMLHLYYEDKDLLLSVTRNPVPASNIAEDVTIVTAEEIEAMNAHTLTDVLSHVTGLQVEMRGGPGAAANVLVQSSSFNHFLFMLDGVTQNNIASNYPDFGAMPVQNIERIEILKGPASSSWGSALGGVINIVTKSPRDDVKFSGTLSASNGEKNTGDYRGEASGTLGKVGYYISGGRLTTDGLRPNDSNYSNNLFSKLKLDLPDNGEASFWLSWVDGDRTSGEDHRSPNTPPLRWIGNDRHTYLSSALGVKYHLSEDVDLDTSTRISFKEVDQLQGIAGLRTQNIVDNEAVFGGSVKLLWRHDIHNVAVGVDYDHGDLNYRAFSGNTTFLAPKVGMDKWGIFATDTIAINKLSVIPGVRYDVSNTNGNYFSPSLGMTYSLTEDTVFRTYAAKGFSVPEALPGATNEKIWSVQAGIESSELRYIRLKGTYFRNETWNIYTVDPSSGSPTTTSQRREGVEVEAKTTSYCDTSLSGGFIFTDVKDFKFPDNVKGIPTYTWDVGVHYDDMKSLRATLLGRYTWWNAAPVNNARYTDFIWDATVTKRLVSSDALVVPEVFFSVRNLFNGRQYLYDMFQNAGRWVEGGVRFKF